VKDEFLRYLGESNSLTGYQKSNRLVLLNTLFSLMDVTGKAILIDVVKAYRKYYLFRKNNGYITDIRADDAINNVDISTDAEILTVIKRHPFRVLQEKNFLEIENISGIVYFVFNQKLIGELCADDISNIKDVIKKKLRLYFSKVDENEKYNNDSDSVNKESEQLYNDEAIDIMGLSVRSNNCLKRNNIFTVVDLLKLSDEDLMSFKNLGLTSFKEIKAKLEEIIKIIIPVDLNNYSTKEKSNVQIKKGSLNKSLKIAIESIICANEKIENAEIFTQSEVDFLEKVKVAVEELGGEICMEAYLCPEKIIPLNKMFSEFLYEYQKQTYKRKELFSAFSGISIQRKQCKVMPFIIVYTNDEKLKNVLKNIFSDCEYIYELDNIFNSIVINEIDFLAVINFIKWLVFDINELVFDIFSKIYKKDRSKEIIGCRANGGTLEVAGQLVGVTRERIRQIEKKVQARFDYINSRIKILLLISAIRNGDSIITEDEILEMINVNTTELIYFLKNSDSKYYIYNKELKLFILDKNISCSLINEFLNQLPNRFLKDDLPQLIEKANDENIPEELILCLINKEYKLTGEFYHNSNLSLTNMYKIIVEQYYQNGIKLFDEFEMMRFKARLEDEFGEIKWNTKGTRSISARITDFTVLCDRGRYILPSQIRIDIGLLNEIHNFVHNHDRPNIMFTEIFEMFKERLLSESNIDNRYFLQGVLKYYWKDEFSFSRDTISRGSNEERNIRNHIEEFIKNSDKPITIKEIKEEFLGITDIVVNMAILEDSDILQWGFSEYIHASLLNSSDEDVAKLKEALDILLEDGTVSSRALYEQIFRNGQELLNKNKIHNHIALFSMCQYLYPDDYSFSRPYISNGNTGMTTDTVIEEYVANFDELSIIDLKLFFDDKHMKIMNFSAMLDKNCRDFLRCDDDMLIRSSKLNINESIINDVQNSIISTLGDKGYIAACNYNDFFFFPYIGVKWTGYMLVSFVKSYCDKLTISQYSIDHRYLTEIIVKCDIGISNHNELIRYAIKFEDIKARFDSIVEVEEFLKKEGLIANTASIPPVLFQNGTIEIVENGRLKIN